MCQEAPAHWKSEEGKGCALDQADLYLAVILQIQFKK